MFVVQNTDPLATSAISATFYDISGNQTGPITANIGPNLTATIDQRTGSGVPGSPSSFQGSVVLGSNTQVASVVNIYGGTSGLGTNFRFDNYPAINSESIATTLIMPQLLKNLFDSGTNTTYTSLIAIQNSGNTTATVTATFYAYPSGTYTHSGILIPPGSSAFLDLQTDTALTAASTFYGSGQIVSDVPVAVAVNQNGAGSLATYLGYIPGIDSAQTVYLPQILKGHFDPGTNLTYSTSILIMSTDGTTANFTITYKNIVDGHTYISSGQANPAGGKDQRSDSAIGGVPWFFGTAIVTADKPVIVIAPLYSNYNPSVGLRQVYYRAFTAGTGATRMFAPLLLKNSLDAGSGVTWSTGVIGQYIGTNPQTVTITYYYSDGTSATSTASVSSSSPMFGWDQRSDPHFTKSVSAAVITCPEQFAVIVQQFGSNSALGDASGVYSGIR